MLIHERDQTRPQRRHGARASKDSLLSIHANDISAARTGITGHIGDAAACLRAVRKLCDERGWLLMLDEVQCGIGRTGKWFAHQWAGIRPDVMPLAKGLGSGVPVGAVVCGPKAADVFGPGNHGTTFGGNPLAMRAGVETLRIMEEDGLLANQGRLLVLRDEEGLNRVAAREK